MSVVVRRFDVHCTCLEYSLYVYIINTCITYVLDRTEITEKNSPVQSEFSKGLNFKYLDYCSIIL